MDSTRTKLFMGCFGCVSLISASASDGNSLSSARSVGMGGAYVAAARGIEAVRWNPANLGLRGNPRFSLNLLSFGVGFGNSSFNLTKYNRYTGKFLSRKDLDGILADIPDDGLIFDVAGEAQVLSFSFRRFAISATLEGTAGGEVAKDYVDLAFNGNLLGRRYAFEGTRAIGVVATNITVSIGWPVKNPWFEELAVGANVKYLRGHAYGSAEASHGNATTFRDGIDAEGSVVTRHAKGGSGWGFDFGLAAVVKKGWTVGFGISNVLSDLAWSKEPRIQELTYFADRANVQNRDSQGDYEESSRDIETFSSANFRYIRLGVARETRIWTLTADLHQEFRSMAALNPAPSLSIGAELQEFRWLLLRGGLRVGGHVAFAPALGLGTRCGAFAFDLGFGYQRSLVPTSATGATIALSFAMVY